MRLKFGVMEALLVGALIWSGLIWLSLKGWN